MRSLFVFSLACGLLLSSALPAVLGGSPSAPEVSDPANDADPAGALDITAAWITADDAETVAFHVLAPALPSPPSPAGSCASGSCVALALSFKLEFQVLAPNGSVAPTLPGYNRTYLVYRHGAPAGLDTAVGYFDAAETLTFNGEASATVAAGGEIVLTLPRAHPSIHLPPGESPGPYRIHALRAYSSPQLCSPAPPAQPPVVGYPLATPCSSLSTVNQTAGVPPVGRTFEWDSAPDTGHGADFVFPGAAPPATTSSTSTSTTTATETPTSTSESSTSTEEATQSSTSTTEATHSSSSSQAASALGGLALAGLALAAVAVRRRL